MFVYSTRTDIIRKVTLCPHADSDEAWEGILGCGIGHGLLHRLPQSVLGTIGKSRPEDMIVSKVKETRSEMPLNKAKVMSIPLAVAPSETTKQLVSNSKDNLAIQYDLVNNSVSNVSETIKSELLEIDESIEDQCIVQTRYLGQGKFCGKRGGVAAIELDWALPVGATAIAFLKPENFKVIPLNKVKDIYYEPVKVVQVDLQSKDAPSNDADDLR